MSDRVIAESSRGVELRTMAARIKPNQSDPDQRRILAERLRYLAFKARRNAKSLSLSEIDELCQIVVVLAPHKDSADQ